MQDEVKQFPMNYSDGVNINNWTQKFNSAVDNDRLNGDRDRIFDNFAMYSGVNKGQWDEEAIERLRGEGRPAHQFNLIMPTITMKLGQLEDSPFQTKFVSREPENQDEVDVLQKLYDYDYATGNWASKLSNMKRDGLIHTGILQAYINYERDPMGNFDLRTRNPTQTYFDHNWQTEDIKDCRWAFTSQWLTPDQIKEQFKTKSVEVDDAIRMSQFSTDDGYERRPTFDRSAQWYNSVSDQFKVIEAIWTEREKIRKVFDAQGKQVEKYNQIMYQQMPLEALSQILKNQGIGYKIDEEYMDCTKVFTFAPGLSNSVVLAEGYYPLQLGRLPFIVWSFENLYGQRQGLVDLLKDEQEVINKRQSQITHSLGTSGLNNYFVESDTFDSPAEISNFKNNQAKGGQTFLTVPGSNNQNKIMLQQRPGVPNDLFKASQDPERLMDKIASVGSSVRGESEKSGESNALFNSKASQSKNSIATQLSSIRFQTQILGEMYFYGAKQVYGGAPRVIKDNVNGATIELNRKYLDSDDSIKTKNDINSLPRHDVIVNESPSGRSKQQENMMKYMELKKVSTNPILQSQFEKYMIPSLGLPEDETAKLMEAADIFTEFQMKQIKAQSAQMDATTAQFEAQAKQAGQPPQPQGGQPPQDNRAISKASGAGPIPSEAGIAGGQGAGNNASNNSPSDFSG